MPALDIEPGALLQRAGAEKGLCLRIPRKVISWLLCFGFLALFLIGFGIGFAGGQNAPPTSMATLLPHSAPPPPWFAQTSVAPAAWQDPPSCRLVARARPGALSGNATWDRLTYDATNRRLLLGLQLDGLVSIPVTPAAAGAPLALSDATSVRVANSGGCNGIVVANELGYCGDAAGFTGAGGVFGSGITIFNLATQSVVATVPVAQGVGVDSGVFDAQRGQVIMTLVNGSVVALDAPTGMVLKTADLVAAACGPADMCDPLEFPLMAAGSMFVNAAAGHQVLRVDPVTLAVTTRYDTARFGCLDPTGLAADEAGLRLFIGCGNAASPQLLVLHLLTGARITSLPIGRGNDGVAYDATRRLIFASSGAVGTLTVVQQHSADVYAVREVVFTKMGARTLALDTASGTVFTMAPDGRYNPALPLNADMAGAVYTPNEFFPNTLDVLAYDCATRAPALGGH